MSTFHRQQPAPLDLSGLLDALRQAEAEIGRVLDRNDPPLDDIMLETVSIRPFLPDGQAITGLRIGHRPGDLIFRIMLLPADDR